MNKKLVVISCIAAGMVWGGVHLMQSGQIETPAVAPTPETVATATSTDDKSLRPADVVKREIKPTPEQLKQRYETFMAHLPPYMAGVELPGRYNVDEAGNLIVDTDLKDMLDFFLETIGDLSFDEIYDLIAGSMIASLQEPARGQALALLDNYFSYLDAYDHWEHSFDKDTMMANNPAGLREHMVELQNMRQQYLGEEAADAFFAELEQTNFAYLDAQIALQQPNLSDTEKAAIKESLKESLPTEVREAQEAAMTQVNLAETTRALQESGASDAEIYQARVEMVGEAAAKRLEQVDAENRAWDQKRSEYKALLNGTAGLDGMTDSERQAYIADVAQRELGLSTNEIKRMQALDRIEAAESIQ